MTDSWSKFFSQDDLLPLGEAFGWRTDFVWSFAVTDISLFLAFASLGFATFQITKKAKIPFRGMILGFMIFISLQALWHLASLFTVWEPWFWLAAITRIAAAISGCLGAAWVLQYWEEVLRFSARITSQNEREQKQSTLALERHFSNIQFEKLLKRSVFLPIAMSLILIIVLTSQITYIVDVKTQVASLTATVNRLSAFQRRFAESENSIRGYMLTKDPAFLDNFEEAQSRMPVIAQSLRDETEEKIEWQTAIEAMTSLHAIWVENALHIRDLVASGKIVPIETLLAQRNLLAKSKETFTSITNRVVKARDEYSENADHATYLFILVTVSLSGLVGALLAFWSRRQILTLSGEYARSLEATHEFNLKLEQKVEERTRDLAEANLALSALNAELEAFSYSVSHDLRGPLRGIDGFSRILVEDYEPHLDEAGKKHITFIREGVRRMGQLIDDLLKLSRLGRVDVSLDEIDLAPIFREIFEDLVRSEPGRRAVLEAPTELKLYADENLLRIVVENLMNNAWKFTSRAPETRIHIEPLQEGELRGFAISDNGAGFDMNFHRKLFQAFQRLHSVKDFEGTGIGLALCKRIVQRHGGVIRASSKLGEGARFEVLLPDNEQRTPAADVFQT